MAAVPLLSGIAATEQAEFATSYPLNLEPVAIDNKLSAGQLRATSGAVPLGAGPGADRGGICWRDQLYRAMGTKLVRVGANGAVTIIGDIGGTGPVRFDYGFDRLGLRSGTALWYYNGTTLTQVTDPDLGTVLDAMWVDGYWMTTDGTYVPVTELSDPTSVLPLKYGTAEEDPDPITGLMKIEPSGEVQVIGRYTIQPLRNVGGNGFPFQAITEATIPYGCVSASAKCAFGGSFAFVGSARNEALRVYVAGQGDATPISTRAVDDALAAVADPTQIVLESRVYRAEQRLFVHLPIESWVFCAQASATVQQPVWYRAQSGAGAPYRIRNAVAAYGQIIVGDLSSSAIGTLSDDVSSHFAETAEWQFDCGLVPGPGILNSVELKGLPGRGPHGEAATVYLSMTRDGETFSPEAALNAGMAGERAKRLQWRPGAYFPSYLGLRFRGRNHAMPGFAKCEVDVEQLG